MRKSIKIFFILLVIIAVGTGVYIGYKVFIQGGGKTYKKLGAEYLDKNLTRPEARKAILEYQEGTGDRTPPFEVIASKRLSKRQMREIDSDVDRALPGYEKAWFVQIEMENGGHFGYFLIKDKDFGIVCYRKLIGGDPMYRLVVKGREIYKRP